MRFEKFEVISIWLVFCNLSIFVSLDDEQRMIEWEPRADLQQTWAWASLLQYSLDNKPNKVLVPNLITSLEPFTCYCVSLKELLPLMS